MFVWLETHANGNRPWITTSFRALTQFQTTLDSTLHSSLGLSTFLMQWWTSASEAYRNSHSSLSSIYTNSYAEFLVYWRVHKYGCHSCPRSRNKLLRNAYIEFWRCLDFIYWKINSKGLLPKTPSALINTPNTIFLLARIDSILFRKLYRAALYWANYF